jgi:hypothetical protein
VHFWENHPKEKSSFGGGARERSKGEKQGREARERSKGEKQGREAREIGSLKTLFFTTTFGLTT